MPRNRKKNKINPSYNKDTLGIRFTIQKQIKKRIICTPHFRRVSGLKLAFLVFGAARILFQRFSAIEKKVREPLLYNVIRVPRKTLYAQVLSCAFRGRLDSGRRVHHVHNIRAKCTHNNIMRNAKREFFVTSSRLFAR